MNEEFAIRSIELDGEGPVNQRTFTTFFDADMYLLKSTATKRLLDRTYTKVDITITWEDGKSVFYRRDFERGDTLSALTKSFLHNIEEKEIEKDPLLGKLKVKRFVECRSWQ
jgi:hypothetical protein